MTQDLQALAMSTLRGTIERDGFESRENGMRLLGYAWQSVTEDLRQFQEQVRALDNAGCDVIYKDNRSSPYRDKPFLAKARREIEEGECLVIHTIDRIAITSGAFVRIVNEVLDKRASVRVLKPALEITSGEDLAALVSAMSTLDQQTATDRIRLERIAAIKETKALDPSERTRGRLSTDSPEKVQAMMVLIGAGMDRASIQKVLGITPGNYRRILGDESHMKDALKTVAGQQVVKARLKKSSSAIADSVNP